VHRLIPFAVVLLTASAASAQSASREQIDAALSAIYPSVVRIEVVTAAFNAGKEWRTEVFGSGTIVSADGYVVTNHHVAGHARRVRCSLSTNEEIPADVVGTDPLSDITVLKLRPEKPRAFSAAAFGNSASLARGEAVLALGSPLAISQSVTLGIVSNTEMVLPRAMTSGVSLDGEDVGSIVRWIAHDAAIFPGNSGGPLVDVLGRVIGITTSGASRHLQYAVRAAAVTRLVEHVARRGTIPRAYLGVGTQPVVLPDPLRQRLSLTQRTAVIAVNVKADTPAASAGLVLGDIIVSIGGHPIAEPEDLVAVLRPERVGEAVTVSILRGGEPRELQVTIGERPHRA